MLPQPPRFLAASPSRSLLRQHITLYHQYRASPSPTPFAHLPRHAAGSGGTASAARGPAKPPGHPPHASWFPQLLHPRRGRGQRQAASKQSGSAAQVPRRRSGLPVARKWEQLVGWEVVLQRDGSFVGYVREVRGTVPSLHFSDRAQASGGQR